MRMFDDAVDWKKSGDRALTFFYPDRGKLREQHLEKRREELWLQLASLSLFNETSWQFQDRYNPDNKTGFSTREYISGSASLNGCRIHGVALDDTPSVAFVRLDVAIYPVELEKLKETTSLQDSPGELVWYWADDEVHWWPELYAKLHLDYEHFNALARNIQAGGIRSARIKILAGLFGLEWGGIPGADADYVILLEDEGSSKRGRAKARLNELTLEWSPVLDTKTGGVRDKRSKVEAPVKGKTIDDPDNDERPEQDKNDDKHATERSGWSSFLRRSSKPRT